MKRLLARLELIEATGVLARSLGIPGSRGEDLLALLAQLSLLDPEVRVYHRGLREPHLSFRRRELPAALSPARP